MRKLMPDAKRTVSGLVLGLCLGAFALEHETTDYWDTTKYVNHSPDERTTAALAVAIATPVPASDVAGDVGGVFDSRWFSSLSSVLSDEFLAFGPGFMLFLR